MDFSDLKNTVSNLTLYDIKAGFRKAQNAVMNYTEMEAKVREATNNEPWGASSTTMQEIANGTFNYQTLNEIMPLIYRRFTEKSAEESRQIYKALQLLEFLIKHGSERVIDDARSHITFLKMLRQFHFIDPNGKDQGINVRNRAKELTELLGDVERIRSERRKARATKNKYTGVEGGLSFGGGFSSGSRFGGFGNESSGYEGGGATFGGFSGGVYGDGSGFCGQTSDFRDSGHRSEQFEEYDEFDETERLSASSARPPQTERAERAGIKKTTGEKAKVKEPEVDLFSFDEPEQSAPATSLAPNGSGLADLGTSSILASAPADDDDEFDDFQSATPSTQPTTSHSSTSKSLMPPLASTAATSSLTAPPQPLSPPQSSNAQQTLNMPVAPAASGTSTKAGPNYSAFASKPATTQPATTQPAQSTGYKPSGPNYFGTVQAQGQAQPSAFSGSAMSSTSGVKPSNSPMTMANMKPVNSSNASSASTATAAGDAFGALWGKAGAGIKKSGTPAGTGLAMGQLAKEKRSAGIWGSPAPQAPKAGGSGAAGPANGSASDDLLG